METSIKTYQKNSATFIHLSVFTQFIFPLGNFIAPLLLWLALRKDSLFVDNHGRRALNFQMSMFIYALGLVLIAIPFIIWQAFEAFGHLKFINDETFEHLVFPGKASGLIIITLVFGILLLALCVITLFSVISAAVSASNGEAYKFPLSINFLKPLNVSSTETASDSSPEV